MTNEKCINEIAKDLCSKETICTCTDRNGRCAVPQKYARIIYDLGYRKETEGKWLDASDEFTLHGAAYRCSKCLCVEFTESNYCPNCGSIMTTEPRTNKSFKF